MEKRLLPPGWYQTAPLLVWAVAATWALAGCGGRYEQKTLYSAKGSVIEEAANHVQPGETLSETPPATEAKAGLLPEALPMEFVFATGAGAWGTSLVLERDGSFEGGYDRTEMGDAGENYKASHYTCEFKGKFGSIEQIDEYTYSMALEEIATAKPEGEEWIEEDIRYVAAQPFGMEQGTEFLLYTPETPTDGLSQGFLDWWPKRYLSVEGATEVLGCYGLYNKEMEYGFFTHEETGE